MQPFASIRISAQRPERVPAATVDNDVKNDAQLAIVKLNVEIAGGRLGTVSRGHSRFDFET
ncbi:MAG: hypothetical protein AUH85_14160 [Chloroflexi bacterium 13_1_40CM_4_68_4]|nr:MAG: hypothetical protein AUH85_14160 [Chloroflexi bacterium 13_1_40CM_4_68_4]